MRAPWRSRRSQHLAHDHVEEREPVLDLDQRLGPVIPMLVPRPPFSFSTTAWSSAAPSPAGSSSASGSSSSGSISDSRQHALLALAQPLLVVGEGLDGDLRQPLRPHLVHGRAHGRDPSSVARVIELVTEADLPELLPLMRAYCDFYEVDPSDEALLAMSRELIADPEREGLQLLARDDAGRAIGFATIFWTWTDAERLAPRRDERPVRGRGRARRRGRGRADRGLRRALPRARRDRAGAGPTAHDNHARAEGVRPRRRQARRALARLLARGLARGDQPGPRQHGWRGTPARARSGGRRARERPPQAMPAVASSARKSRGPGRPVAVQSSMSGSGRTTIRNSTSSRPSAPASIARRSARKRGGRRAGGGRGERHHADANRTIATTGGDLPARSRSG